MPKKKQGRDYSGPQTDSGTVSNTSIELFVGIDFSIYWGVYIYAIFAGLPATSSAGRIQLLEQRWSLSLEQAAERRLRTSLGSSV